MCITRKVDSQDREGVFNQPNCSVTASIQQIYKDTTGDILSGSRWTMHLLRIIEDGHNMDNYLKDEHLKSRLNANLEKVTPDEKGFIRWKIRFLKKQKKFAESGLILFIEKHLN